jgi:hypothetical protein
MGEVWQTMMKTNWILSLNQGLVKFSDLCRKIPFSFIEESMV